MKGKIRTALAAMLVIALMTGCVFGPPTATTPEISMAKREISATETLEFSIDNYFSVFKYSFKINDKEVTAVQKEDAFTIAPVGKDGRWEKSMNTLTVTAADEYGNVKSASKDFQAVAKDYVKYEIKDDKLILTPVIEKTTDAQDKRLDWKIGPKKEWTGDHTNAGASLTVDLDTIKMPEVWYELSYEKSGLDVVVLAEGIIELPVKITNWGINNHSGTQNEDGSFTVSIDGSITPEYEYEWVVKVNDTSVDYVPTFHSNGRFTFDIVIPRLVIKDGKNKLQLFASYKNNDSRIRTIESEELSFIAARD